jgi:hypothetical protein
MVRERRRGSVNTEYRESGVVVNEDTDTSVKVTKVDRQLALVRIGLSVTHNLGDYNSVKVSVEVERPCDNTEDAIRSTRESLGDLVDEFIDDELDAAIEKRG